MKFKKSKFYLEEKEIWGFVFYTDNLKDVYFLMFHGIKIYKVPNQFISKALFYKRVNNKILPWVDKLIFHPSTLVILCDDYANIPKLLLKIIY